MTTKTTIHRLIALWFLLVMPGLAAASTAGPIPQPGYDVRSPVSGMRPASHPEWLAAIRFEDGETVYFSGPKGMFKYLLLLPRHAPDRSAADIADIYVTDFYSDRLTDAREAHYIVGSRATGPMGHEAVPVASRLEAEAFMREHDGKAILGFDEVTAEVVEALDRGTVGALVGSAEEGGGAEAQAEAPAPEVRAAQAVEVVEPHMLELPPVQRNGAMYMTLKNHGERDHVLVAAHTGEARAVELHTHVNDDGVMRMRQLGQVEIPAGQTVRFEPGGLHLMVLGLAKPLQAGNTVSMTLHYEDGSAVTVSAPVQARGGGGSDGGREHHKHGDHGARAEENGEAQKTAAAGQAEGKESASPKQAEDEVKETAAVSERPGAGEKETATAKQGKGEAKKTAAAQQGEAEAQKTAAAPKQPPPEAPKKAAAAADEAPAQARERAPAAGGAEPAEASPVFVNLTTDHPEYATSALNWTLEAMDRGHPVTLWLNVSAVSLAIEDFPHCVEVRTGLSAADLVARVIDRGGRVLVCSSCLTLAGFEPESLMAGAALDAPDEVMPAVLETDVQVVNW